MHTVVFLICLLPALSNAAAVPALQTGITLSSQVLDLVKSKYFFLRTSIDQLQKGIDNLQNTPINEEEIASLEPQILSLSARVRNVLANPQILDRVGFARGTTLIRGLADLREILPSNKSAFDARFRRVGAYGTISQVINEINELVTTLGARV
ncbi:hypothetical protein GCK32_005293 [Trichostrongylus colubriformis]|uniref:Uncharacterized protein n=1 Tax=Trichostrongylus colubriformis TaxID=6319 RepID=A0AAN8G6R3_TRICO